MTISKDNMQKQTKGKKKGQFIESKWLINVRDSLDCLNPDFQV